MASRSFRSNEYLTSEDMLPIDYHGLDTKDKLKAHTEQFRITKEEIVQGKRRRRNSTNDCRTSATIQANGPDHRFNDIAIEESGIRDGLLATKFMPFFPNVQDFTRRSSRWDDLEQASVSEHDEIDDSSLLDSISNSTDFSRNAKIDAQTNKPSTRSQSKPTSSKTVATSASARSSITKASTSKGSATAGVFYKCYAQDCKYEHARRGNFSIHWKRDAKHPGTFDIKKVLECRRDQDGGITIVPYGGVNTHRQRLSDGTAHDVATQEIATSASNSDVEDSAAASSRKRKAPSADPQNPTRAACTPASVDNEARSQQDNDPKSRELPGPTTQTNSARIYSALECQIFKRLADVPTNFPANLTPLITHGTPDAGSADLNDCRFFCPACDKCFTQTHNVASHFTRHHGKPYSKNDRARTIICRVTVSQSRVNVDSKPIDDTILPRLQQIRQDRLQTLSSGANVDTAAANARFHTQKDDPSNLKPNSQADLDKSLVTTTQMILPGPVSFHTANPFARDSARAESPQQPSQRVRRMHAVRQSILTRISTSSSDGDDGQTADSNTTPKADEALPATKVNADNQHQGPQTMGLFGVFRLSTPGAGSIAASRRQPAWQDTNQTVQGPRGQKRKRSSESDSSMREEEIQCTDDEMDSTVIPLGAGNIPHEHVSIHNPYPHVVKLPTT